MTIGKVVSFRNRFSLFLVPSIFQGALSFAMVPVITYVLDPKDFGVFALVSVLPALVTVVATAGAGYLLAEHYPVMAVHERQQMISTIVMIGMVMQAFLSSGFLFLWQTSIRYWDVFAQVPVEGVVLSFGSMLFAFPWVIASDIITLDARARLYAFVTIVQSIVSAITVTLGLYTFQWGVLSLFVAVAVGAMVSFVGAVVVLRPYVRFALSKEWAKRAFVVGVPATAANLMENFQTFFERYTLSAYVGLNLLGLYSHSQQYRSLVATAVKAVARSVWPLTLAEARSGKGAFPKTGEAWGLTYIGITVVGLVFATLGADLLALWTHDKFTDAFWLVALWTAFILVQNSGKAQTGILYACGQTVFYSRMMLIAGGAGIVMLVILIPLFGVSGVVIALFAQQILFRAGVQFRVRKLSQSPFQDTWMITGTVMILMALGLKQYSELKTGASLGLFAIMCTLLAIMARRPLANGVSQIGATFGLTRGLSSEKAWKPTLN